MEMPIRTVLATCAALGYGATACAATIEGQVAFPGQVAPPMTAYVCEIDTSRIRTLPVAPGQAKFSIELPVGRYIVFLAPRAPGAPNIYGAHTRYSLCVSNAHDAPSGMDANCADHRLADVTLATRTAHAQLNVDDWALSDEIAAQLDRFRGIEASDAAEPLAAPHFSEYKVAISETGSIATAAPKLDAADANLAAEDRTELQQALAGGPNFAGTVSLVKARCGNACERLLLLDWRSGKVIEPAAVGEVRGTLPCRADEAIVFRRDSRLVSITSVRSESLVTQYFVWKPDSATLAPLAEYPRSLQGYCSALPP